MGSILAQVLFAIIPSLCKALLERFLKKSETPAPEPKTADSALLDVANAEAKVQHEISDINAAHLSVPDALARLRDRAANSADSPDNRGGA